MKYKTILETSLDKNLQQKGEEAMFKENTSIVKDLQDWFDKKYSFQNLKTKVMAEKDVNKKSNLYKEREDAKKALNYWTNKLQELENSNTPEEREYIKRMLGTDKVGCKIHILDNDTFKKEGGENTAAFANPNDFSINFPKDFHTQDKLKSKQTVLHEMGHILDYLKNKIIKGNTTFAKDTGVNFDNGETTQKSFGIRQSEGIAEKHGFDKLTRKDSFEVAKRMADVSKDYQQRYQNSKIDADKNLVFKEIAKELKRRNISGNDMTRARVAINKMNIKDEYKQEAIKLLEKAKQSYSDKHNMIFIDNDKIIDKFLSNLSKTHDKMYAYDYSNEEKSNKTRDQYAFGAMDRSNTINKINDVKKREENIQTSQWIKNLKDKNNRYETFKKQINANAALSPEVKQSKLAEIQKVIDANNKAIQDAIEKKRQTTSNYNNKKAEQAEYMKKINDIDEKDRGGSFASTKTKFNY